MPISQIGNLLRYKSDKENNYRCTPQKRAHVGQPAVMDERPCIVDTTEQKEHHTCWHEQLERRVQRCNLEDNQQEANSIA